MPDLLIELFSEEIPARMQRRAAEDLQKLVTDGMVEAGLTYASAAAFSTPRRLTLTVENLLAASPTTVEERKGPRADAPDKAIEGFLRGAGLTRDQLEERDTPKGPVLFAKIEKPGRPAADIVAEVLEATIRNFPWPKSMRWGTGVLRWVRPLHSILCILSDEAGAETVPMEIDGVVSGDTTAGHRFLAAERFSVTSFDDYMARLKRAHVVLDPKERAETIWHDATNIAFANGLEVVEDAGLLAEVAGLVEWPMVLMGKIADDFLDLPPEVLQTSMKEHQKFFSVRNPKTCRIERFITVANTETADDGATILAGNEKVLSARLADAKFFWDNDLRVAQSDIGVWLKALENVTFHNKLGTQADLIDRIAALSRELAPLVGADPDEAEEAARLAKADLSSEMGYEFPELQGLMGRYYIKAAGHLDAIAAAAQEHYAPLGPSDDVPTAPVSVAVALAEKIDKLTGFWLIDEKPTGSKDPFALRRAALGLIRIVLENNIQLSFLEVIPKAVLAMLFSLGSRQDRYFQRLVQSWSHEDGEREPRHLWLERPERAYTLHPLWSEEMVDLIRWYLSGLLGADEDEQRSVQNANKSFREFEDRLHKLDTLIAATDFIRKDGEHPLERIPTLESYDDCWRISGNVTAEKVRNFLHDRLKVYLRDQGIRHDIIDACIAMEGNDDLTLLVKRARALSDVLATDDGENLIQGFKRANNILTQAEAADGVEYSYGGDVKYAETDEERALFAALDAAETEITPAIASLDFATAMSAMAALRGPIDAFFETVKINADNATVRRNRLNLLSQITRLCSSVADLTRIEG